MSTTIRIDIIKSILSEKIDIPSVCKTHYFVHILENFKMFTGNLDVEWFNHVKHNRKTVEGRLNVDKWTKMKVDNTIVFKCVGAEDTVKVIITDVRTFKSFREMLESESHGVNNAMPGDTIDSACEKYKEIYKEKYGSEVVGIKFKLDEST